MRVRRLRPRDREPALARLCRRPRENLLLIDATRRVGERPPPGDLRAELLLVESSGEIEAVASLQPMITVDIEAGAEAVRAFLPYLDEVPSGLIKAPLPLAETLWRRLAIHPRRITLDRVEHAYALSQETFHPSAIPQGVEARAAAMRDLPALVEAARASLREEDRPDPFRGDAVAFRAWVASRIDRAKVLQDASGLCFVAYADVQCREGWLLQGVYTPHGRRRRGFASAGVSRLCEDAFAAGAAHVQLAVVEGNAPAACLYQRLGFRRFGAFRTLLFG